MLTLEEFRKTKRINTEDEKEDLCLEGPAYIYADSCHIDIENDGDVMGSLVIYNEQWMGTVEYLETVLYDQYYIHEHADVVGG